MSNTEKAFIDIPTMVEALQEAIAAAESRKLVNNTLGNHAAATFMGAAQWMLIDLSKAAVEDRLLKRLVELQQEFQAIKDHLTRSQKSSH